ncbi:thioredoxin-domain-containing protein [Aulographum hederae CBS 113979]|uniref:protein disulfide-isomerase n=1 Tax=Aulographum hederae CBS 113979 TaxID=1176131 RepID=A0A6G1GIG8_9PEZI|nr:thioredoxin-domain-containing protein [Aulographum hederae CBS 113979]
MVNTAALVAAAASVLLSVPGVDAAIYTKNSPVLQVDGKSYDRLIARSNHTSIVEFYAPWCGHCQNLKPAYEKAARNLAGLAKVAAINCDDEMNKPFCGRMGVQGFPTLKIVKPGKKPGSPFVDDYQGARTAKAIVEAVVDKIPNHVKRVQDKILDEWLSDNNGTAKAILFTDKSPVSALLRSLAIDYLGSITFGQVRKSEEKAVETFGITKYPTLVVLPGGDKDGLVYDGEMKKEGMNKFLSQIASPNPDPAPQQAKPKKDSKKDAKKDAKASSSFSKASASHEKAEGSSAAARGTAISLEDEPTASPDPNVVDEDTPTPIPIPKTPELPSLATADALKKECLHTKSQTCVLALLPPPPAEGQVDEAASTALKSLLEVKSKHAGRKLFPFYSVPASNDFASNLRTSLSLKGADALEIIVLNGKRGWYKHYTGTSFAQAPVEDWIDAVRMGEGKKASLPEGFLEELPAEEPRKEPFVFHVQDEQGNDVGGDDLKIEVEEVHDEL